MAWFVKISYQFAVYHSTKTQISETYWDSRLDTNVKILFTKYPNGGKKWSRWMQYIDLLALIIAKRTRNWNWDGWGKQRSFVSCEPSFSHPFYPLGKQIEKPH